MIEVFKTNVQNEYQAATILDMLSGYYPLYRINFDLDDCDRILRVEGANFAAARIAHLVAAEGYDCEPLV